MNCSALALQAEVTRHSKLGRRVRLMFQDEARFGRITEPSHCWAPRGMRPRVHAEFVREYTHAYAAVGPHDGILDSLVLPEVDARSMSLFLEELVRRHPREFILVVLDGAGWHTAKALKVPETIRPLRLPPYSPELNPVEHLRDEVREKKFHNVVFQSMEAVEDRLAEALAELEQDPRRVRNRTVFRG
ncbi:MAG TPA: IS630 family transposase [Candidatus Hydrogenedentes bacterium]|nr:IS630 family transposase [Candidatus Hydrogenedentota bacterium]HQM50509.1 IS630 family transposase [Candidatus Hydrogenedentota bacterium]